MNPALGYFLRSPSIRRHREEAKIKARVSVAAYRANRRNGPDLVALSDELHAIADALDALGPALRDVTESERAA